MTDLFYRFVIFVVSVLTVVIDNWLMVLLIVLVYVGVRMVWSWRSAEGGR